MKKGRNAIQQQWLNVDATHYEEGVPGGLQDPVLRHRVLNLVLLDDHLHGGEHLAPLAALRSTHLLFENLNCVEMTAALFST